MTKCLESPVQLVATPTGVNAVPLVTEEFGETLHLEAEGITSTPGTPQTLISSAGPAAGLKWRLRKIELHCRAYTKFGMTVAGDEIRSGTTTPDENNFVAAISPYKEVLTGQAITLEFLQSTGAASPVTARIFYTEHPA